MSGQRRLVNSANTIKGNSQETLKKQMTDSNTVAKGIKGIPLKSKKK